MKQSLKKLGCLFTLAAGCAVEAVGLTWTGAVDSDLLTAGNWSPAQVPTAEDALFIKDLSETTDISLSADLAVSSLELNNAAVDLAFGTSTLTAAKASTFKGASTINFKSGRIVGQNAWTIGDGDPLTLTISGVGTYFSAKGPTFGYTGSGHRMTVKDGAEIYSTSHMTLLGYANDSELILDNAKIGVQNVIYNGRLYVGGKCRNGKFIVRNKALVEVPNDYLAIGQDAASVGNEMLVTGEGTRCITSTLYVGMNGQNNVLRVEDGASFSVTNKGNVCYVGQKSTATGNRVIVSNATFTVAHATRWAGTMLDNAGTFEVMGENATFTTGQLSIDGGSTLRVTDGATFNQNQACMVGTKEGSGNHLVVSNCTANVPASTLTIGNGNVSDSSFEILGGTYVKFPDYARIFVGNQATDHHNYMVIDGKGSTLTNGILSVYIGGLGSHSWARVSNGGKLFASDIVIGGGLRTSVETAVSNRLEVVDGGLVQGAKNTMLRWGGDAQTTSGHARHSQLLVRGGTVNFTTGNAGLDLRAAGVLRIEGTNSLVKARLFNFNDGAAIEFKPPEDAAAFDQAAVQIAGNVTTDGTGSLRVSDVRMCMKNGGGTYTLISSASADLSGLTFAAVDLPDGCVLIRETNAIKVKIPSSRGTIIILR